MQLSKCFKASVKTQQIICNMSKASIQLFFAFALILCVISTRAAVTPKDIIFRLYGDSDRTYITITANNLDNFSYDPTLKYIVLCHNYNEDFNNPWYKTSINSFMKVNQGSYVVLAVGYKKVLSEDVGYKEAMGNIQTLGEGIGEVLVSIRKKGVPADKVEVVGLGMGAHIAGIAANFMDKNAEGKAFRLFGLDPVKPASDVQVRLIAKADSRRTIIIHTSDNGIQTPLGHIDFYPNGGTEQITCSELTGLDFTQIAGYFFACSINQDCRNSNCKCKSWKDYMAGACEKTNAKWVSLGYLVADDAEQGTYYGFNPCRELEE